MSNDSKQPETESEDLSNDVTPETEANDADNVNDADNADNVNDADNANDAEADAAPEKDTPQLSIVPVQPLSRDHIRGVIEAALLAADDALTIDRLFKLFVPGELAEEGARAQVREALVELEAACEGRGFELKKVASGYRMQVRQDFSPWVSRLWEEKPPRYTRALLETMALIAYKQPATRGDIEEVRGVTVSSNIMRTLLERGWIREVGQRDVPGRPSMYGTTKEFLDYFNLSSLDELPSLPEIRELVEPAAATPDDSLNQDEAQRSEATKALLAEDLDGAEAGDAPEFTPDAQTDSEPETESATDSDSDSDSGSDSDKDASAEVDTHSASAAPDGLQGVPGAGGSHEASAPVFADNEVLVVSETATVEVLSDAPAQARSSADAKE